MNHDQKAAAIIREMRTALGPELLEEVLKASASLPPQWRKWSAERGFEYLRCRLKFTQDELAAKAGLAQSQVSHVEGGLDALLSTWQRAYAAMGFDLVVLPLSNLTLGQLEKRAEQGRPAGHWLRQRPRPRRRWLRGKGNNTAAGYSPNSAGSLK